MRIASAEYMDRGGMLAIAFENGDHFEIATELALSSVGSKTPNRNGGSLKNGATRQAMPQWDKVRIGVTGDVLEIPFKGNWIEIPWDRIRTLADPKFRDHLANKATVRANRLGACVKSMRLANGLTRPALAAKVGVLRQTIVDLEAGKAAVTIDVLRRIATALGKRLQDFARPD